MELGHPLIDQEHEALVGCINTLVEALFHDSVNGIPTPTEKSRIAGAVESLRSATEGHFRSEERLMEELGYPQRAGHNQQHAELLQQFGQFVTLFHSPRGESVAHTVRFLREWFEFHVDVHDGPLVRWINERPESGE